MAYYEGIGLTRTRAGKLAASYTWSRYDRAQEKIIEGVLREAKP